MHDDRRQNNTSRPASTVQSRGNGQVQGGAPAQNSPKVHTNISGRQVNPAMRPGRTVNGGAQTPSRSAAAPRYQYRTQQGARPGATANSAKNGGAHNTSGFESDAPLQMRSRSAAPVQTAGGTAKNGQKSWLRRTFAVDPKIIEERNIVREEGSMDYAFFLIVLVLLAFGTIMVYSASYAYSMSIYGDSYHYIFRQLMFVASGLAAMIFVARRAPETIRSASVIFYIACVLLLIAVPFFGKEHNGAKRWLDFGFTEVQPSEFMKLGLVMLLAKYYDRYYERVTDYSNIIRASFFGVFVPIIFTGIACGLVAAEKHLSGTIIMFMIGVVMIFASGTPIRLLVGSGVVGGTVLGAAAVLTGYTKRRIDIWLHPEASPLDGGYQTLQGLYAIGSGGLFGKGLGNSYQKHLFVSQPQNDFIFTIVCEELGFIGALAVVILFLLLAWRGFVIAMRAPDTFSSLVVIGIVSKVVIQAILNIAVVTNSIPNTGISLPFFSYGGSSLVVLLVEMGIVLSVSRFSRQKK